MPELLNYLPDLAIAVLIGLFSILWWSVRRMVDRIDTIESSAAKQTSIDLLWEKHDEDAKRLDEFQLEIAKKHYERTELDQRFDRLEKAISQGLEKLGEKIDKMMLKANP